jgi:hypothetical protein
LIKLRIAAAGDLANDKVPHCYTCQKRGYPHEAITIEEVKGRPLSDGINEVLGYKIKDYFTGSLHQHKQQQRGSI